ncbi:multicopper oxidase family protein [Streptomyces cynarae]|uniref:multicopper oxidase family protein n=1 Tax=Streptomyces cynarae TaxID=2981134 RepID=UPI00406C8BC4
MVVLFILGFSAALGLALLYGTAAALGPRAPRLRRALLVLALLPVALRLVAGTVLVSVDRLLAADFVPLALPPLVAAVCLAPPRGRPAVWRVRGAAFAAIEHLLVTFSPPAPPYLVPAMAVPALLLGFALAARRWEAVMAGGRLAPRWKALVASGAALAVVAAGGWSAAASRLPDRMSMASHGSHDMGHGHGAHGIDISTLTGPRDREPDRRFTLTARRTPATLASGQRIEAWTFNGRLPGPELRVRQGELVEVTLVNRDVTAGVTVHWHGVDVPNAEDGVAGMTQDAVPPGGRHVYRFVADRAGSFWYHSHQQSAEQVERGLFGALIVDPARSSPREEDLAVVSHRWTSPDGNVTALSLAGGTPSGSVSHRAVRPGGQVRLRLINADSHLRAFALSGVPFAVAAIDGTDLGGPTPLRNERISVPGGGRYDLTFTMPDRPVQLRLVRGDAGVLLSPTGRGDLAPATPGPDFDPASYGRAAPTPFDKARFDRHYTVVLGQSFGFYDGRFALRWTIDGKTFPNVPTLMVRTGDLVRTTFVNRSFADHPMHLHGHRMLVLSRNGHAVSGSPWWSDTLNVAPGERYEVAFRADNPGLWMDHCHNLAHAGAGMTMHLAYEGYESPYEIGRATANQPE